MATCVELRRGHEIVLVRVHGGGDLEFDHGSRTGDACGEHQLQLERAAMHTDSLSSVLSSHAKFRACMVDELTRKEIAQLPGKAEAAVRQHLCAARKTLTSNLAEVPPANGHAPAATEPGETR